MPDSPFSKLRSGDISKTSPISSKDQELVKRMVLASVELQIPAVEALGSVAGFVTWVISHFATEADQAAALTAFLSSVQTACSGHLTIPLSNAVKVVDAQGKPL